MEILYIIIIVCILFLLQINESVILYYSKWEKNSDLNKDFFQKHIIRIFENAGQIILGNRILTLAFCICGIIEINHIIIETTILDSNDILDIAIRVITIVACIGGIGILIPRTIGKKYANTLLLGCLLPFYGISLFSEGCCKLLTLIPKYILTGFHKQLDEECFREFCHILPKTSTHPNSEHIIEEEDIKESTRKIFKNALEFSSIKVRDCIVPRTEVIAVGDESTLDHIIHTFTDSGKTRIIVYHENIDHIVGYIHSSDILSLPKNKNWQDAISGLPIVPESMGAQKMMQIMLQKKKTLAIVADEFGGTSGIISLEDLVEEIFGDIEDEHDNTTYICRKTGENEYLLSARLEIDKINETLNINLPSSDDYTTLGGFILFNYEDFPKENQDIEIGNYSFHIQKTSRAKILLVKLKVRADVKK